LNPSPRKTRTMTHTETKCNHIWIRNQALDGVNRCAVCLEYQKPIPPTVSVEDWEQRFDSLVREVLIGRDFIKQTDELKTGSHFPYNTRPKTLYAFEKDQIKQLIIDERALAKQQEAERIKKAIDTDTFDVYCGIKGLEVATGSMKSQVYRLMPINLDKILGGKKLEE